MATATRRRASTAGLHPDVTVVEAAAVKGRGLMGAVLTK
jgi:hypothetical protein